MKTVVLGSGGWGTALSLVLHRNGHPVTLWSHVPEKAAYMERARENPRLEGVPLPPELRLTADMACLTEAELVVVRCRPTPCGRRPMPPLRCCAPIRCW